MCKKIYIYVYGLCLLFWCTCLHGPNLLHECIFINHIQQNWGGGYSSKSSVLAIIWLDMHTQVFDICNWNSFVLHMLRFWRDYINRIFINHAIFNWKLQYYFSVPLWLHSPAKISSWLHEQSWTVHECSWTVHEVFMISSSF